MDAHGPAVAADMLDAVLDKGLYQAAHALRSLKQGYAFEVNFGCEWGDGDAAGRDRELWEAGDAELAAILARLEAFASDYALPHVAARRRWAACAGEGD